MNTVGYLFQDEREEGARFCLFMDGLADDDGRTGEETIEVRFHDLWEFIDVIGTIRDELGAFEMRLGEPEYYAARLET